MGTIRTDRTDESKDLKEVSAFGTHPAPAAGLKGLREISCRTTQPCFRSFGCRDDRGAACLPAVEPGLLWLAIPVPMALRIA
jgi:hypothetical protein